MIDFDYYYGSEYEQHQFFAIPKQLITDPKFKRLSSDAKFLYGLFLDRLSLSRKNHWFDNQNRVFIIYRVEPSKEETEKRQSCITEDLNVSGKTAIKLIKELSEINLIEVKRQGLGKPNIIYVKNFASCLCDDEVIDETRDKTDKETSNNTTGGTTETIKEAKTLENTEDSQICKNYISRSVNFTYPDVKKFQSNKTNINNTKKSNTKINSIHSPVQRQMNANARSESVPANIIDYLENTPEPEEDKNLDYDYQLENDKQLSFEIEELEKSLKEKIDKKALLERFPNREELIEQVYQLILDEIKTQKEFKIKTKVYSKLEVIERFKKLSSGDIEFALNNLDKLQKNGNLNNTRKYLFATLFDKAGQFIGLSSLPREEKVTNSFLRMEQSDIDIDELEARLLKP